MNLVYLVNDNGSGGSSGDGGGDNTVSYPLVKAVATDGAVGLQDRCVTRIELKTPDPVRIVFPPKTEGMARDFILRLTITADTIPEVTFAVPTGETFSFEEADDESFACSTGINIFAFTETDPGVFVVNRKIVSVRQQVAFDPTGGTIDTPTADFLLGAKYGKLPLPERTGYVFVGWTTEDGVEVTGNDTVKSSVTRLVAVWEDYVDKFEPVLNPGGGMTFLTDGDEDWFVSSLDGTDCAVSGPITHNGRTSLYTTVTGAGTISFDLKVSSEASFDKAFFYVDGVQKQVLSGEKAWATYSFAVAGAGTHTLEWRYKKDGSVSKGSDCCWLKNVVWEAS